MSDDELWDVSPEAVEQNYEKERDEAMFEVRRTQRGDTERLKLIERELVDAREHRERKEKEYRVREKEARRAREKELLEEEERREREEEERRERENAERRAREDAERRAREEARARRIHDRDQIRLLNVNKSLYLANPVSRKNWPGGRVDGFAGVHAVHRTNGHGRLRNGDFVRLVCKVTTHNEYDVLYSAESGAVYYDKWSSNEKQQWQIQKTHHSDNSSGAHVAEGDYVVLYNMHWPDAVLHACDGHARVECTNSGLDRVWQIGKDASV